ncbi:hypothetical protein NKDENANG_03643 [Candidatus Entotheonellaceae bacterium PAL068K]
MSCGRRSYVARSLAGQPGRNQLQTGMTQLGDTLVNARDATRQAHTYMALLCFAIVS